MHLVITLSTLVAVETVCVCEAYVRYESIVTAVMPCCCTMHVFTLTVRRTLVASCCQTRCAWTNTVWKTPVDAPLVWHGIDLTPLLLWSASCAAQLMHRTIPRYEILLLMP